MDVTEDFLVEEQPTKTVKIKAFDFSQVQMRHLAIHKVGNALMEGGLTLSKGEVRLKDETVMDMLARYFLNPFKEPVFYNFYHPDGAEHNELMQYCAAIFQDSRTLHEQSINIAHYLKAQSNHAKIKSGEFYVVYFEDCVVEGELVNAIGLFKSENKDTYLKVLPRGSEFDIDFEEGIDINRLDKGCLIFETEAEFGYKICSVDLTNKNSEALYWKESFLIIRPRQDNFYHTKQMMKACNQFCNEVLIEENQVSKAEQLTIKDKALEYFSNNSSFSPKQFAQEVLEIPQVIEAFEDFKQNLVNHNEIPLIEDFEIAPTAVKSEKKYFKSVIKLDKNFHIYVHGNPQYLMNGFDEEKNMHYYKLYYNTEIAREDE